MGERIYYKEDLDRFIVQLSKHHGNITKAAKAAGINGGRKYILKLAEEIEWFKDAIENITVEAFDDIEEFMVRKARNRVTAAKFMLQNHKEGKKRGYGKRTEVTGADGNPISWVQLMHEAEDEE